MKEKTFLAVTHMRCKFENLLTGRNSLRRP